MCVCHVVDNKLTYLLTQMEWPHGRPFGLMGPLTLRGTWKLIPTASGGRHVDITAEWCCAVHLPSILMPVLLLLRITISKLRHWKPQKNISKVYDRLMAIAKTAITRRIMHLFHGHVCHSASVMYNVAEWSSCGWSCRRGDAGQRCFVYDASRHVRACV